MIWKKSNYKLMTGKWKIGILLEAGYEILEAIDREADYIKLGDRIYFHAGPLANHSSQMLLPEETKYFCEGLRMVSKSFNHVLCDNSCLSIAIQDIQFSDCAIQNEAFTACAIQWASEVFQFPMPDIPVVFNPSQGISEVYSFDFSMVRDR